MKKVVNKFSILTIALIISISAMTACSASEKNTNDKVSAGTESHNVAAENKSTAEIRAAENKSVEKEQKKTVKVYDGRDGDNAAAPTQADKAFIEKEIKGKESEIKKIGEELGKSSDGEENYTCEGETLGDFSGKAEGSFTKPNSRQTAYLYTFCQGRGSTGSSPFFVGGLLIVEDGKAVANYVYGDISNYGGLKALPDINQNGLSEIIIGYGSSHMGVSSNSIRVMEVKEKELTTLGNIWVYNEDSPDRELVGISEDEEVYAAALDISVQPGKSPAFSCDTYFKKTENDKWQLKKKAASLSLENPGNGKTDEGFRLLNE